MKDILKCVWFDSSPKVVKEQPMKLVNNETLMQIHTGMRVFDRNEHEVGTIEYVQFTDEDPTKPGPETATETVDKTSPERNGFVEGIARAIAGGDDLPEEVRQKLLRDGYIKIDTGLLRSDVYALPDQVSSVSSEKVYLDVTRDELISV
jgi:hypothetical protein